MGHPDKESFCNALAEAYETGARESNAEVKRINIADLSFDPSLRKGYKEKQELELDLINAQESILWSEHIVWIFPTWWSLFPAIMKGFIDRVLLPGFAYKHQKNHLLWKKLLRNRSSRLIITMDGPKLAYFLIIKSAGVNALKTTLKYSGINPVRVTYFDLIRKNSQEKLVKKLEKTKKLGAKQK